MLIPIRDVNPRHRFPAVTVAIMLVNAAVFLVMQTLPDAGHALVLSAGAIPVEISTFEDFGPRSLVPPPFTILTSMFLHGGFLHLLGNMWFLWLFGDNVEDRLGRLRFVAYYLVTGAVGALAQCFLMPQARAPMIGASGAVAGILGGYVLLFPGARVVTLALWSLIPVPAWVFLGIWFVGQFFLAEGSGIAWLAHVGGFLAGVGLVRTFAAPLPPPAESAFRSRLRR